MFRLLSPTYWFGPLFHLELTQLARRGLHNPLRWGLGLILLVVLFAFYSRWFPLLDPISLLTRTDSHLKMQEMARFSESFVFALLMLQLGIVIALTPFLAAGSIVEERRKQTMEFLLMSPLTEREIVLGKLAARLVYVAAILFAVLPIMALMQFWGGIDFVRVVCGFIVVGMTMLSLGGMSVYFAVQTNSLGAAVASVYFWFILLNCASFCCSCASLLGGVVSPFTCLWMVFDSSGWRELGVAGTDISYGSLAVLAGFAIVHAAIAARCVVKASNDLRKRSLTVARLLERASEQAVIDFADLMETGESKGPPRQALNREDPIVWKEEVIDGTEVRQISEVTGQPDPEPFALPIETKPTPEQKTPRAVKVRPGKGLGDEDDSLVWKECEFPRRKDLNNVESGCGVLLISATATVAVVLLIWLLAEIEDGRAIGPITNWLVRWFGLLLFGSWCLKAALRSAESLTREREEQTLLSLLTLPVSRSEILKAKWRGGWGRGKMIGGSLLILGVFGLVTTGLHLAAFPLVVAFAFACRLLSNTLGLWLTTICRTTLRAQVWTVMLLIALCAGPYLLAEVGSAVTRFRHGLFWANASDEMITGLSPIYAWQNLTFYWRDLERERAGTPRQLASALLATAFFLTMAGVLWWDARRRFEKEGK